MPRCSQWFLWISRYMPGRRYGHEMVRQSQRVRYARWAR